MRVRARLFLPAVGLAALFAASSAADAAPICTGTAEDGYVCVDPDEAPSVSTDGPGTWVGRCVLLPGAPQCQNVGVTVPGARLDPGRPAGVVYCSGNCGTTVVNIVTGAAGVADPVVEAGTEIAGEVTEQHRWCFGTGGAVVPRTIAYAECMTGTSIEE